MYKPIISILFFTLFCTKIGIPQDIKITPHDLKAELDSWTILGLTQDDNGYIWLADIQNGLFRYDGSNFKRYSSKGGSNLGPTSNRSECITTDGHYIWHGTFSNGLNMLDPETGLFTHYKHDPNDPNSIRSDHIRTLAFDQQGMLWIGTMTGVDKFDPETKAFTHIHTNDPDEDILKEEHIRAMYVDREGILWIGTSSPFPNEATVGGLFKMEVAKGSITHYQSSESENTLIDNRVRAIFEDSRGAFWVGTSGDGLHTMDRDKGTFTRHTFDIQHPKKLSRSPSINRNTTTVDHITFINEDDGGNIWIGTFNGGLSMYDPEISEMTYYYQSNSIAHEKIDANAFWTSLKTKDQLLWITTWPDAAEDEILYQITAKSKQITATPAEFASNIRSLVADGEGGFYYGGSDGIWHEDNAGNDKRIIRLEEFEGASAPGARELVLNNNKLWFPTVLGLYSVNLQNNELDIYDYDPSNPLSPSTNAINSIEYVGNDQLLLGTDDGIELFDIPSEKCQPIQMIDKVGVERSNNSVGDIYKDSKNRIWLSVLFNGIRQLNLETGEMQNYRLQSDGENVIFIFEDSQGTIWIGAVGSGLYRLNEKTQEFEQYADLHHILDENCAPFTIAEDDNQNLWIGVIGGIAKLNLRSNQAKLFGSGWGINTFRILEKAALATGKGDIILGSQTGYYRFHPDDLQLEDDYSTFPFIDELYINDKGSENYNTRINTQDSRRDLLELTYNENSFSFTINHLDYFTNSGDQSLQYRLVGHDPNWRNVDSGERLSFYNIPPGNYNFEAKVLNLSGSWQEKNIDIFISQPWWNTWWAYILYGVGALSLGFGVHRFQKDRTIRIERERTKDRELEHAKEIEKAYSELKSFQSQLIQAEKMASLGELTAGIAHEIQNPLNFVNNFSDVNTELIDELLESITSTDFDSAQPPKQGVIDNRFVAIKIESLETVKELAADIKANEEKIKHHGSRADSIVKGMLQHSRTNAGEKVPTDINALADEYLRLSYHGLRAKDISFNATMETNFDDSIGKIQVIPQEIGRVFLNVINNAFYACSARSAGMGADRSVSALSTRSTPKALSDGSPLKVQDSIMLTERSRSEQEDYKPLVTLTTKRLNDSATITISDNGIGMSKDTLNKVFQPFFTTKPTGSGTGLGMSISYDIITKGHGGEMKVESKEGEGTTFIISIPIV